MNLILKILIALVIGFLVMVIADIVLDHGWAVILGIIAGLVYFLNGSVPTTRL